MMDWGTVRHFKAAEFLGPCGCGKGEHEMRETFIRFLDGCRRRANVPFVITSGYRCAEYNKQITGASKFSSHMLGWAADIATPNSQSRYKIVRSLFESGTKRIGIYHDGHVHVDLAVSDFPQEVAWTGES